MRKPLCSVPLWKPSLDRSMITLTFNTTIVVSESDSLYWQLQLYLYVKSVTAICFKD